MKAGRAYYTGGCRVLIDGTPCRVARLPSKAAQAWMRADALDYYQRMNSLGVHGSRQEKANERATQARHAISVYADMLEISEAQAKARIAAQRLHEMANPPLDLSLEYDL